MFYRTKKRLIIITIYILIIAFFSFLIARPYTTQTCFDGKKNQDEKEIDCGGICEQIVKTGNFGKCEEKNEAKDIELKEEDIYVIYGGEGFYDVLIKVANLNEIFGAESFEYVIDLKNASGDIVAKRTGKNFLLPLEKKYIIENNLETNEKVVSANVSIKKLEVKWVKFTSFETPKIRIQNQRFGLLENGGSNYAEAFGLMVNDSPFDFNKIVISVIIRDSRGIPIAVNKTDKRTVNAGDRLDFKLLFPREFPGGKNMSSMEVQTEVNVYDDKTFMKKYAE